jgi:hypothetical protein
VFAKAAVRKLSSLHSVLKLMTFLTQKKGSSEKRLPHKSTETFTRDNFTLKRAEQDTKFERVLRINNEKKILLIKLRHVCLINGR